jgi:hypothetical protein
MASTTGVVEGAVVVVRQQHNCNPDPDRIAARNAHAKLVETAENSRDTTRNIVNGALEGLTAATIIQLPSLQSMARNVPKFMFFRLHNFTGARSKTKIECGRTQLRPR